MLSAGAVTVTGDTAPNAWRRQLGHLLRGDATPDRRPAAVQPPTPTAIYRAMIRQARLGPVS